MSGRIDAAGFQERHAVNAVRRGCKASGDPLREIGAKRWPVAELRERLAPESRGVQFGAKNVRQRAGVIR